MKTRLMSSKGEYTVSKTSFSSIGPSFLPNLVSLCSQGVTHCIRETAKLGPLAFYKVI